MKDHEEVHPDSMTFISHADSDIKFVRALVASLKMNDVNPWMAAANILPGRNWEKEIANAIELASAVVVIVSKASVESVHVRGEVNRAIKLRKPLFPVVIEQAEMPLHWQQYQRLDWGELEKIEHNEQRSSFKTLVEVLPKKSFAILANLLSLPGKAKAIRELIMKNPQWLPMDTPCRPDYIYINDFSMASGGIVDVFAGRFDSGGPRCYLYYLGSPYRLPFTQNGTSEHLARILRVAARHLRELQKPLLPGHGLRPDDVLPKEEYNLDPPLAYRIKYGSINVRIVLGRRAGYLKMDLRDELISKWCAENTASRRDSLDLLSYDRLLSASRDWPIPRNWA